MKLRGEMVHTKYLCTIFLYKHSVNHVANFVN